MSAREDLIKEIVKLLNEGHKRKDIRRGLHKLNPAEIDSIMKEAYSKFLLKATIQRVIWLLAAVLTFLTFYSFIPNGIYNKIPFVYSLLGSIAFSIFLVQFICNFRWKDLRSEDKSKGAGRIFAAVFFGFFSLIITSFVFWTHYSSKERDELTKNGILVKGTILDGSRITKGDANICTVEVYFKTVDGKDIYVHEDVSKEEFDNLQERQKVDLLYSPSNPRMIALILTDSDFENYLKIEQRELTARDLVMLLYLDYKDLGNKLQSTHRSWKFSDKDSIWINNQQNAVINIQPGAVKYIIKNKPISKISDEFKSLGYNMVENGYTDEKCDTDSISIRIGQEQEYTKGETTLSILTVVTILKK